MCQSPLHEFLAALPKCEHHIHLEGALSPALLFTLAASNDIALPSPKDDPAFASPSSLLDRYTRFTSLDDFLRYYFIGMSVLVEAQDFEALAWDYFVKAKVDGVVHAEVFFDPQAHTARGVRYSTVIEGFTKACARAENELGISTKLILCFLRHLPVKESDETFREAETDLRNGVLAGIGLSSTELGNPPAKWQAIYSKAKQLGIKRTAHAGEEGPVDYIKGAVRDLDVERIDHGIRLPDNRELMQEVAERKMLVTMCPLSNVRLKCAKNVVDLPVRNYLDAGVRFSINSDDPAYFRGYILDNYCAVQEAFDLTKKEWEWIAKGAVEGSWCDATRKENILKRLDQVVRAFVE